jgi:SOS-response transcriptional repressor LexA
MLHMDRPNQRLRSIRERSGYETANDAARAFGWNENTYASHENGNRGIPPDAAIRYAKAFRFSLDWLYTGANTMKTAGLEQEPNIAFKVIPRLSWEFMKNHGGIEEAMEKAVEFASLPKNIIISMPSFSMTVIDDSMLNVVAPGPSFSSGDELVFSTRAEIRPGDFVLAELFTENSVIFRQYKERGKTASGFMTYDLSPLNNAYPTTSVTTGNQARIIARLTHVIKAYK